jgi:hypothetical protein
MTIDMGTFDNNVDHFLISTRENQFLLIFVDAKIDEQEASTTWED